MEKIGGAPLQSTSLVVGEQKVAYVQGSGRSNQKKLLAYQADSFLDKGQLIGLPAC
jgi:hypothetical protein